MSEQEIITRVFIKRFEQLLKEAEDRGETFKVRKPVVFEPIEPPLKNNLTCTKLMAEAFRPMIEESFRIQKKKQAA